MLKYAICQISGKQYQVFPNKILEVDFLGEEIKNIEVNVLLLCEDGKIKLGKPFLKEKLNLKVLDHKKGEKIRIAKFHAKANFRRLKGFRPKYTNILWDVKKIY
ncbi:50S ribosomal protein L21 [Candidatus Microgenomates bacterium]|nr:50S ribosomal protein L21 [Candidatus Microgenomates bacterium]